VVGHYHNNELRGSTQNKKQRKTHKKIRSKSWHNLYA
jgi:hypothetical protein